MYTLKTLPGVAFLIGPGTGAALVASGVTRRTVFLIAGSGALLSAVILPDSCIHGEAVSSFFRGHWLLGNAWELSLKSF